MGLRDGEGVGDGDCGADAPDDLDDPAGVLGIVMGV